MSYTAEEEDLFVSLLDRLTWPVSRKIFEAYVRNGLTNPIELGVFRDGRNGLEILMLQRPEDDREFPPLFWHIPGSVVLPSKTVPETMEKLLRIEVGSLVTDPIDLGWYPVYKDLAPNRPAISLLHACRLIGTYEGRGTFWPVHDLPQKTLRHHRVLVPEILKRLPGRF